MIEKFYPSKKVTPIFENKYVGGHATEAYKAHKLGLTIDEYRKRVVAVSMAFRDCTWVVGDVAFPYSMESMEEHGQCRIIGVCPHYDQYGTVEWHEPPFILMVRPVVGNKTFSCTANFLTKENPLIIKESC